MFLDVLQKRAVTDAGPGQDVAAPDFLVATHVVAGFIVAPGYEADVLFHFVFVVHNKFILEREGTVLTDRRGER